MLDWHFLADLPPSLSEEFSIYLNYVRKLGFEETPDYDFLRELFAKVMKNNGDIDDQVYDWNLLNGIPSCSVFRVAMCSTIGLQEGEGGSLPQVRTIKPCNRYRTPSRHESLTFLRKVPPSPRPLLWSAMDPRKVNPQAPYSCRPIIRPVLGSSPLSPASLRSIFRSHRTDCRTVTMSGTNRTLEIRRMIGHHRWYQRSKTYRHHLSRIVRVVCRMEGSQSRMRTNHQSLVFGGF